MSNPGPLLRVEDIVVRFGGITALGGVSAEFFPDEVVGLIGPNGAGKTTLFDVMAGSQMPASGQVELDGADVTHRSITWRARRGVRRTFQRQQVFGWLSVEDNLLVASEWRGGGGGMPADLVHLRRRRSLERRRRQRVADVLELCRIGDIRHQPAGLLPIGRARMVEMARAIVDHPRVLLLDEPASGLNERESQLFGETIQRVRREEGCTVVLVEHDVGFVMKQCHRIIVLQLGKVLAVGSPKEISDDIEVATAYLGR
jgi:branched-chain amino acid transport system ATP-binding protein